MEPQLLHQPPKYHHHRPHDISGQRSLSTLLTVSRTPFPTASFSLPGTLPTRSQPAYLCSTPGICLSCPLLCEACSCPFPSPAPSRSGVSLRPHPQAVLRSLATASSTLITFDCPCSTLNPPGPRAGLLLAPGGYRTILSTAEKSIYYFVPWVLKTEWFCSQNTIFHQFSKSTGFTFSHL